MFRVADNLLDVTSWHNCWKPSW